MSANANAEMPFLDHLEELRWRLIWSLGALAIGFGIGWWLLSSTDIFRLLEEPIAPYLHGKRLVYTHPADTFRILMSGALAVGMVLALPVIAYQTWAFLSPALHKHEKRIVIPVLFAGTGLFVCGVALCFKVILPLTLRVLLGIQSDYIEPMITVQEYFDFAITFCLGMGAVFELPIVIIALTALGVVTPAFLSRFRRHAIVLCLVGAAFITPGADPFSLFALAVPLYLLYEVSVAASYIIHRRRLRRQAADRIGALA
ncbi:MAG: Sec-independent protein translocase protein TatC [Gemmatimonadaceae bacterium]|nr:Sec-independent protein translocase protein TatC [Gemmatimonadaceae bacterium]